jgi:hypothetical protein
MKMKKQIISPETPYTFSDYFKMNVDIEDLLDYFGYSYQKAYLDLPQTTHELDRLQELQSRLEERRPFIAWTSEMARREFLIAPVIAELIHYTQTKVKVEYPLEVTHQLKGTIDYYLRAKNNLLIVEAKNADITRGFTQLAVELIAIDQADETDKEIIFGAISIGELWQFGTLDRKTKVVNEDLNQFLVPVGLEKLMRVLVGILE